jgi:hypothetical protein
MAYESLILDARGNPFQGNLDTIGGEVFTDARVSFGLLGALNAELVMDLNGKAVARFDLRTTAGALTVVFEATVDGTNYFPLPAFAEQQTIVAALKAEEFVASVVSTAAMNGVYAIGVSGYRRIRARVSAYTSGNITVTARASTADEIIYTRNIPSTFHVTATAANAVATATLPAAGVGLFHYVTDINLVRATTTAVVGTALLTHTSTNLPGTPNWTAGNAIAIGQSIIDLDYSPTTPLKSSVANTATTIVMPAGGAGVQNRVNVSYYVGS